jgi:O-Antigen ligase
LANSGAYFPLMLVTGLLFPEPEDIKRLIKFCLIIYIPVGFYAIWQQVFGLNSFEIDYLKSGYTVTITDLDDIRPRPFSTLNSPHALTIVTAILASLAFFLHFKGAKREAWQIPVGILFTAACLASLSRAGWVVFAVAVIGWICFRRAWTTIGFYGVTIGFFVLLIANADRVLHSLDALQRKLPGNSALTEEAFRLGTFSDRLYSYQNLMTNPLYHTWFGNPELREHASEFQRDDAYAHDQLTQILVSFGFVGLAGFLLLVTGGLCLAHRRIFAQRDREARAEAIAVLSVLTAVVYSGMLFGSHLGVFPVNSFFSFLVGCLTVFVFSREKPRDARWKFNDRGVCPASSRPD